MQFNFDMLYLFVCLFIGIVGLQQKLSVYLLCLTQKPSPIEIIADISLLFYPIVTFELTKWMGALSAFVVQ